MRIRGFTTRTSAILDVWPCGLTKCDTEDVRSSRGSLILKAGFRTTNLVYAEDIRSSSGENADFECSWGALGVLFRGMFLGRISC